MSRMVRMVGCTTRSDSIELDVELDPNGVLRLSMYPRQARRMVELLTSALDQIETLTDREGTST